MQLGAIWPDILSHGYETLETSKQKHGQSYCQVLYTVLSLNMQYEIDLYGSVADRIHRPICTYDVSNSFIWLDSLIAPFHL